jgi:hypothetical protein
MPEPLDPGKSAETGVFLWVVEHTDGLRTREICKYLREMGR